MAGEKTVLAAKTQIPTTNNINSHLPAFGCLVLGCIGRLPFLKEKSAKTSLSTHRL